ncbi:hypothetical protein [Ruania zhangjianzhongii]|uniref:hypothetical protein n=1 Tax=Ruania zhangjianzhongii TaxID=2603206 RepID=UPI0011CCCF63|nr:hypothetical protein [Ruania zhangjianzhongii]
MYPDSAARWAMTSAIGAEYDVTGAGIGSAAGVADAAAGAEEILGPSTGLAPSSGVAATEAPDPVCPGPDEGRSAARSSAPPRA